MMEADHIDPRLFNSETQAPFESCLVCHRALQPSGEDYFVERILRRVRKLDVVEPLFEYALCMRCAEQMRASLSKESLQSIEVHFSERLQSRGLVQGDPFHTCLLTGKDLSECEEFSYHGHCRGNSMIRSIFPYAISDDAMDEIAELLSAETTDQLDDFKGNYFSGPPELADILNPRRILPL